MRQFIDRYAAFACFTGRSRCKQHAFPTYFAVQWEICVILYGVLHWTPKKHEWCARYRERYPPRHFGLVCTLSVIFVAFQKLTATLQQLAYHILSFLYTATTKPLHVCNRMQMCAARLATQAVRCVLSRCWPRPKTLELLVEFPLKPDEGSKNDTSTWC